MYLYFDLKNREIIFNEFMHPINGIVMLNHAMKYFYNCLNYILLDVRLSYILDRTGKLCLSQDTSVRICILNVLNTYYSLNIMTISDFHSILTYICNPRITHTYVEPILYMEDF